MAGDQVLGVLAGLGSPIVLTIGFMLWEGQWKGSAFVLNSFKCSLASFLFLFVIPFRTEAWQKGLELGDYADQSMNFTLHPDGGPAQEHGEGGDRSQLFWLILSSFIGIVIGDNLWLQSLKMLGARRVILVDSIKPFIAAGFGWLLLGESVSGLGFAGIFLTMAGVLTVSLEKTEPATDDTTRAGEGGGEDGGESKGEGASTESRGEESTPSSNGNVTAEADKLTTDTRMPQAMSTVDSMCVECHPPPQAIPADSGAVLGGSNSAAAAAAAAQSNPAEAGKGSTEGQERGGVFWWRDDWGEWHASVGYLCAAVNVFVDVYGSVLTKQVARGLGPWEISLVRFGAAAVMLDLLLLSARSSRLCFLLSPRSSEGMRRLGEEEEGEMMEGGRKHEKGASSSSSSSSSSSALPTWAAVPAMPPRAWLLVSCGVVFCTFLAPALNTHALLELDVAVCLSLTSTGPILSLPLGFLLLSQHVSLRALLGTLVATAGVWLLVWTAA